MFAGLLGSAETNSTWSRIMVLSPSLELKIVMSTKKALSFLEGPRTPNQKQDKSNAWSLPPCSKDLTQNIMRLLLSIAV
jgi:hypothetical protein